MARILIVDDEPGIRSLLALVFAKAGYDVATAADGAEAIALCGTGAFDVVLSDVSMPSMNGHELVRWIAANCPGTHAALMSGLDLSCPGCPFSGQCRLLPKPFSPDDALEFISNLRNRPPELLAAQPAGRDDLSR